MLTLEQMFEMQADLDAKIIKEKGLEGKDLIPNTVLALQVELGELANEWRGFKHWSKDQEPRYEKRERVFSGPDSPPGSHETVSYPLLEEYVDCLHFFLSLGRQIGLTADDMYSWDESVEGETTILFTEILHGVGMIVGESFLYSPQPDFDKHRKGFFKGALAAFYTLGEDRFDFTFEQIAEAYAKKNAVNHDRKANGY